MSIWPQFDGVYQRKSDEVFLFLKIMSVKKVFVGYPEMEMVALLIPKSNEIFLHIYDQFDLKICTNIKLDFETAIEFRDELNKLIEIMKNNQS